MKNNQINFFFHPAFGEIRTIKLISEHYFFVKDITVALGYSNWVIALISFVDDEDIKEVVIHKEGDKEILKVSIRANTYCSYFQQVLPLGKNYEKIFIPYERVKIQRDLLAI